MLNCIFCVPDNETIIYNHEICRVILVDNQYYPGYLQIISNQHEKELTDLPQTSSKYILELLLTLEVHLREIYNPDKINIASFGNMVPHVHFHLIPRFMGDRHFPNPIWGDITNHNYHPSQHLLDKHQQLLDITL